MLLVGLMAGMYIHVRHVRHIHVLVHQVFVFAAPGAAAAGIDITTHWLTDMKDGVCLVGFWFNHEHCCSTSNQTTFLEWDRCPQWQSWAQLITGTSQVPPSPPAPHTFGNRLFFGGSYSMKKKSICLQAFSTPRAA